MRFALHETEGGLDVWGVFFGDYFVGWEERGDGEEDLVIAVFALGVYS